MDTKLKQMAAADQFLAYSEREMALNERGCRWELGLNGRPGGTFKVPELERPLSGGACF